MKTLIALDGSLHSESILNMVAERHWEKSRLLRVVTVVGNCPQWDEQEQNLTQAKVILEHRIENFKKRLPGIEISSAFLEGRASEEILKEAKIWLAEKIIIGSHGDSGIRPNESDSMAAEIVNEAPCAVEILKINRTNAFKGAN